MSTLHLVDEGTAADLRTYVARAKRHDEDGAARIQAVPTGDAGVLAVWTCVLPGAGLTRSGLVLGLRTLALAGPAEPLDTVVALASLTDRFARGEGTELLVPPTEVAASWAAVSPPRSGWELHGVVPAARLHEAATAGIAEVATGTPDGAGSAAVAELRSRVWGRPIEGPGDGPSVPSGAAFGMHVLGFLGASPGEEPVAVHASGPWVRLSSRAGYVLAR